MNNEDFAKEVKKTQEVAYNIAVNKNTDYGTDNLSTFGVLGVLVRASDKVARLKNLLWDRKQRLIADEKALDTAYDLMNYATYMVMMLEGRWYKGDKKE